ncbi:MAG: OsmC family protein [Bacteriovoracaceae bacterium]|nr:OsmC family protein [Bacteriovoracaceae bacterium]
MVIHYFFASGGLNQGASPKEYVLQGLSGCTGMDIVYYLKKHKQELLSFEISTEADLTNTTPKYFAEVRVHFNFLGDKLDPEIVKSSVIKSMTKYCGVSYMISRVCPVKYKIELNGVALAEGQAKFD